MSDKILAIFSLLIGFSLWLYVFVSESKQVTVTVPITIIDERSGTMAFVSPKEVSVTVSGSQSIVSSVAADLVLNLNVGGLPEGESSVQIPQNSIVAQGLKIVNIDPSVVRVELANTVSKSIPVKPILYGNIASGFIIESITSTPTHVAVEGKYSELISLSLSSINTKPIDISKISSNMTYSVDIQKYYGIKKITPTSVGVDIKVKENIVSEKLVFKMICSAGTMLKSGEHIPDVVFNVKGRVDLVEGFVAKTKSLETNCNNFIHDTITSIKTKPFDNITLHAISFTEVAH